MVRKIPTRESTVLVKFLKSSIIKYKTAIPNVTALLMHPSRFDVVRLFVAETVVFCEELAMYSDKEVVVNPA